jgi:hypothetical protein
VEVNRIQREASKPASQQSSNLASQQASRPAASSQQPAASSQQAQKASTPHWGHSQLPIVPTYEKRSPRL